MDTKLYQIVDENDKPIGSKLRGDIDWQKDYYRIAALWLTNSKGEVLIAQRLLTKDKDPGKWGPSAAGTVEADETYESNMYKEAEEELGLTGVKFKEGPKLRWTTPRKAFCQLFIGSCDWNADQFTPQPEEVEKVAWIALEDLSRDVRNHPEKYTPSMASLIEATSD